MSTSIYQLENGKWRAEVISGKIRKTKVRTTKTLAKQWAAETERDLILNSQTMQTMANAPIITVAEALRRYAAEVSILKKGAKKEQTRIRYFINTLPNVDWPLDRYDETHLAEWQRNVMTRTIRPVKAGTVLRDYSTLSAFFTWCLIDKKWINVNPVSKVRKPKKPNHRERRIEVHELEKILAALKYQVGTVPTTQMQETALVWLIAIATGMRSSEIVNRRPDQVSISKRCVTIPAPDAKNGTSRLVPLDDFACQLWQLALLIDRGNGVRVFNVNSANRDTLFRKAKTAAGLDGKDLKFHDSRHEAASLLAKRIKNALTLCKVFGWKDPKHALIYYNPTNDDIVNELNGSSGLSTLQIKGY